ncbi:MAG TPA: tol-pal system protein YbgF [Alphaproteobacteria bacterium]
MRKHVTLALCATLPLAGFALSATAQDDMSSYATAPAVPVYAAPAPAPTYMTQPSAAVANGDMTRMGALEQQVRDLTNQVEQSNYKLQQLQEAFDRYVQSTESRLSSGAGSNPTPTTNSFDTPAYDAPAQAPSAPSAPTPPQPSAPAQGGGVSGGLTDPNGAFQPSSTPPLGQIEERSAQPQSDTITSGRAQGSTGNAAQAYDQAFGFLQQSNYTDAENAFRNFLATYPNHPLAANAQYWLGETYFAQTQYSTAAKTFAKAFQDYPKGQKAPDALLKLAVTLEKMNKKNDACLTLKELKKRFPSGPASVLRRGDEEAIRMSCPA